MTQSPWKPHEDYDIRGSSPRWDDLRFPVTAVNPPGQVSDPDVDVNSGLLLFASNATELIFIIAQMPHSWLLGSEVRPHVHWCKSTSAAGNVAWRLRYRLSPIGAVSTDWVDHGFANEPATADDNTAFQHIINAWEPIQMTDMTLSGIINFELTRVGANALDTYGADARLAEFDLHYQVDSRGSRQEYRK